MSPASRHAGVNLHDCLPGGTKSSLTPSPACEDKESNVSERHSAYLRTFQPCQSYCASAKHSSTSPISCERARGLGLLLAAGRQMLRTPPLASPHLPSNGGLTFRRPICFLKNSENSFFLFAGSSSLCLPSPSSYLQGDSSVHGCMVTQKWMHSKVRSPPASQSRSPSFLPRRDPAGSRKLLWARHTALWSWC